MPLPEVICCWKWKSPGYRSTFTGEHVNILQAMLKRHFPWPHQLVCFTDDPTGIDSNVRILPLPQKYSDVPSPHGPNSPSCYRRLILFSSEIADILKCKRFVSIDLDTVIVDNLIPLWDRDHDFMMWGDTAIKTHYNGSMVMMVPGARRQVWEQFDPKKSPQLTRQRGMTGSDQAWISYCLGPGEARWSIKDGVYSFRNHVARSPSKDLPRGARIVFFHGTFDPWTPSIQAGYPWVQRYWRQYPLRALVLGSSNRNQLYDDVQEIRQQLDWDIVCAVNESGLDWPHRLDHWIITDESIVTHYIKHRSSRALALPHTIWTRATKSWPGVTIRPYNPTQASADTIAVRTMFDYADRIVLAGGLLPLGEWEGSRSPLEEKVRVPALLPQNPPVLLVPNQPPLTRAWATTW